jgi:hypothetical protein
MIYLMSIKTHINSRAALMTAILEHSGHLSEFLQDVEFGDCCRYILYTFTTNSNPELVSVITNSSEIHMNNLSNNEGPCITDNSWIEGLSKQEIVRKIKSVIQKWSRWNPDHDVAMLLKTSFDEIL